MKKLFIILAIAMSAASCRKNDANEAEPADDPSNYFMNATKHEQTLVDGGKTEYSWKADRKAFSNLTKTAKDSIALFGDMGEQHLSLKVKNMLGTYNGSEFGGAYSVTIGGDGVLASYKMINDPSNNITLTETNNKQVSGTFNITLISTYLHGAPKGWDTIRFTNGEFKVKIYQRETY